MSTLKENVVKAEEEVECLDRLLQEVRGVLSKHKDQIVEEEILVIVQKLDKACVAEN